MVPMFYIFVSSSRLINMCDANELNFIFFTDECFCDASIWNLYDCIKPTAMHQLSDTVTAWGSDANISSWGCRRHTFI